MDGDVHTSQHVAATASTRIRDMNSPQTATEPGWFHDPVRPWIVHWWDGQRWTGQARSNGRDVSVSTVPTSAPQPARRVELDDLPRRSPRATPVGLLPLITGVLVLVVLVPSLLDRLQSVIYGTSLSTAFPVPLVMLLLSALGITAYGIVALAVARATSR